MITENIHLPELRDYDFDQIIYLKQFLYLPSSSMYKTLKKFHKQQYQPNERLVFAYQGTIPYNLIAHLQRIIENLNITNLFVVICNTDPDTAQLLDAVHGKYSTDPTRFELVALDLPDEHLVKDLINHGPLLNPPETMCMYPWNSLEVKPNGTVRPCCLFKDPILDQDQEFNMNHQNSFSMEAMYMSDTMKDLRQQFRAGQRPKGCDMCWNDERHGKKSGRQLYNWVMKDRLFDIDYEADTVQNVTALDLKLGNLCNLSCRTCDYKLSSSWAIETLNRLPTSADKKRHPAYKLLKLGEWPKRRHDFWNELEKMLPNIEYMQFAGGEPLMLPDHFRVLEKAVELDCAKHITLRYNTNGTHCPEQARKLWREFKLVHLDISIDDVAERFEYQRNGAKWQTVLENIRTFNQDRSERLRTQVTTTVNIMNVYYLPEFYQWFRSENFDSWWLNLVWYPESLSIQRLPGAVKQMILAKLTACDFGAYQEQMDTIINLIHNAKDGDSADFAHKIREIDLLRNQDFKSAHGEIADAMGYVL